MNRNAKENGEAEFSVTAKFVDVKVQDIKCDVTIKRSYNTDEKEYNADKIKIETNNSQQRLIEDLSTDKQKGEELFILEYILLIDIAKFFFFDVEKIDSLAEINQIKQRQKLSRAYSEVLGIQKYEELKESLVEMRADYLKKAADPEDKIRLNQFEADIKKMDF